MFFPVVVSFVVSNFLICLEDARTRIYDQVFPEDIAA
jgi:hypothetical protein